MQFILGIVCHLSGVTSYYDATLGGYIKCLPFLKVLVKVSFQYHLPIKSYGVFNVTDLTTSSLLWVIPIVYRYIEEIHL